MQSTFEEKGMQLALFSERAEELSQLKVIQSFQFEIQFLLSNSSVLHDSPLTSSPSFSLGICWAQVKEEGAGEVSTATFTDCPFLSQPHLSGLSLQQPGLHTWPPDTVMCTRGAAHLTALRGSREGIGPWAFLMDPYTTLENPGRLCPKKSTDIRLLYQTGHMV